MLSEPTRGYLSTLVYRADAQLRSCWLPLSGIYWDDELPDIHYLSQTPADDRHQILRLFGIRVRMWIGAPLPEEDQQFWNAARALIPAWALFHRLKVSADDLFIQAEVERQTTEGLAAFGAEADEVVVTNENGLESVSMTFDLTKERRAHAKKPWWRRMFRGPAGPNPPA